MGNGTWWVCDECKSLNDLPAKKCYKCRAPRPPQARIVNPLADLSSGPPKRVGVTVQLSQVGELSAPDPKEREVGGGGVFETYGAQDDEPIESMRSSGEPALPPPPLREPPQRGIGEAGGIHWELGLVDTPRDQQVTAATPRPPAGAPMPPRSEAPPGVTTPPAPHVQPAALMPPGSTTLPGAQMPPVPPVQPRPMQPGPMPPGPMPPGPPVHPRPPGPPVQPRPMQPGPMPPGPPMQPMPPGPPMQPMPPGPLPSGPPMPPGPPAPSSQAPPVRPDEDEPAG